MELTRRQTLMTAAGALSAVLLPSFGWAAAGEAIAAYTGGAEVVEGGITLTAPEIAENGNTVPIEVEAPGAAEITVFADGNPRPEVATFAFGSLAAAQRASTRIRLAATQTLVAIAKMPDGTFQQASQEVKVTIGGCGG